ncbi:MAG TPA: major capsid family protein [Trichocoleus sp.]
METALRLDDAGVTAFEQSLEYVETKVRERKYPQLRFAKGEIVPLENLDIPWADSTTYRMLTGVGQFELARDYTTNLPMMDVLTEEVTLRTYKYAGGYQVSEEEAYKTVHMGLPIDEQKVAVVNRIAMQTLNKLIAFGDPDTGMPGFINHPAWLRSYAMYPLSSSSTANQCLSVLKAPVTAGLVLTNGIEEYDTMLLPYTEFEYLSEARVDNTLEKTILRQFLDNNGHIRNIQPLNELAGAGPDGENVMIVYRRDPETLKARITDPFRFRPILPQPFGYQRPAAFKYNGILPYSPYGVHVVILPKS